ncbi:hypothetical protein B0H13DRAFT_2513361, partial [Mycena leptocephala]
SPKLTNPAVEGHFVGYDEETKDGCRIYWPGKRSVTVERDVSYNKNDFAEQESVQIEGGEGIVNPPTSAASPAPEAPKNDDATTQRNEDDEMSSESKTHLEPEPTPAESASTIPQSTSAPPEPSAPPPHERRVRRDGLLEPEPNTGRGMRQRRAPGYYSGLQRTAGAAEEDEEAMAFFVDAEDIGEPGGVEVDDLDEEWVSYAYEFMLAAEEGSTPKTVEDALANPKAAA